METQQKVLSHLVMPHHTDLERCGFQKESLGGLAQCPGANVVVVCGFSSLSRAEDVALLPGGGLVPGGVVRLAWRASSNSWKGSRVWLWGGCTAVASLAEFKSLLLTLCCSLHQIVP